MIAALAAALTLAAPGFEDWSGVKVSCSPNVSGEIGRARIEVVVGSGALHEPKGKEGVAHLVEHLLLRPLNFDDNNGATDWDSTMYLSDVAQTELSSAAVSLIGAIVTPRFDPETFDRERKVVLREIDDRGGGSRSSQVDPFFGGTIFDRSIGGTNASVERLSVEDALSFHTAHYVRGNIAVVLSGAADCAALEARLAKELARFRPGPAAIRPIEQRSANHDRLLPGRDPSLFIGGFYWYEEDLASEIILQVVARHLQQRALDDLRARRGITYSPHGSVGRLAGAGLLRFVVTTDGEAGEVGGWYRKAIDELRSSPTPAALTHRAIEAIGKDVSEDHLRAGLATIRGERSPLEVLRALDDASMRAALPRLIAPERAFSTASRSTAGVVVLVLVGVAILGFFAVLTRRLVRG